jgi:hypothetical protein
MVNNLRNVITMDNFFSSKRLLTIHYVDLVNIMGLSEAWAELCSGLGGLKPYQDFEKKIIKYI